MRVAGLLSGGAPIIKKYQVQETMSVAGIPVLIAGTADDEGVSLPTTTACNDMADVSYDTATYVAAQQTDGTSAERQVSLGINPDVILWARLSGDGTTGTALTSLAVTTATTDGLDVTTGGAYDSPEMGEGLIWGYTGANAGQVRRITSTSGGVATLTVAFDNDHQVGDEFMSAGVQYMSIQTVQLTSDFREVEAAAAVATNEAEFMVIELIGLDKANNGNTDSAVLMVPRDHVLNNGDA